MYKFKYNTGDMIGRHPNYPMLILDTQIVDTKILLLAQSRYHYYYLALDLATGKTLKMDAYPIDECYKPLEELEEPLPW